MPPSYTRLSTLNPHTVSRMNMSTLSQLETWIYTTQSDPAQLPDSFPSARYHDLPIYRTLSLPITFQPLNPGSKAYLSRSSHPVTTRPQSFPVICHSLTNIDPYSVLLIFPCRRLRRCNDCGRPSAPLNQPRSVTLAMVFTLGSLAASLHSFGRSWSILHVKVYRLIAFFPYASLLLHSIATYLL